MTDFRYDEEIRRIVREFQRSNLQDALSTIRPLARHLHELQQSALAADVRRSLVKLQETVVPGIPDIARVLESVNTQRMQAMLAGAAEFARRARELRDNAFPPNWSEFDSDEIESVVALMEETGLSLVWVPRAEVVRNLLDAPEDTREGVLVDSVTEIVDDLDAALAEIGHSELVELRDHVSHAVGSFRAGFEAPAQALATAVFTTAMHVHLGLKRFPAARDEFGKRDPMEVDIMLFKLAAIYRSAGRAIETYMGDEDEPIPTSFNRHASTHRVSRVQYTTANALAALLLVTSLLRELEPLFHMQHPEPVDV